MHAANFAALGMEARYDAYDIASEGGVAPFLRKLRDEGCAGANVTIPYKRVAYDSMDILAPSAERLGVVNTVVFKNGRMTGHNTDGIGLLHDLDEQCHVVPQGLRCLILGCGGTGRAVAITLADAGAAEIHLANRTTLKAETLCAELKERYPSTHISMYDSRNRFHCHLILHCAASPMMDCDLPIADYFYDVNYGDRARHCLRTHLEISGTRCIDGLGLLLYQGAESFRLWTERTPDLVAMRSALRNTQGATP